MTDNMQSASALPSSESSNSAAPADQRQNLSQLRVALTYRVLQFWRVPVFRRLTSYLNGRFRAFHGGDFPGTKAVNAKDLSGVDHCQLSTIRLNLSRKGDHVGIPICPTLLFHLLRYRPDVILAEGGSNLINNIQVWLFSALTGTPYVWWTLGDLQPESRVSLPLRMWRGLMKFQEQRAAVYLGYSSLALAYFDRMGYPKDRQFRAVNCVDTDAVLARIPRFETMAHELRRKFDLEDKRVLLYVGAMYPSKRLEDLVEAYLTLRPKYPDVRVMFVGDGPHRAALEQYCRQRGADVIFAGEQIENASAYFLLGDLFVLPGLGGLSISEAMAHGLPLIATQADGCEVDLIEQGQNGFILEVGNVAQLTSQLDEMLADPDRLRRMGEHSRWIIDHRYNINTYMDNVIAALNRANELRRSRR